VLVEAMAVGRVISLAEARGIVRDNFEAKWYEPSDAGKWNRAYERYMGIVDGS
jgi:hypothetical protein